MIKIEKLAKRLEDKLNKNITALNNLYPGVNFAFHIVPDLANYKKATRKDNTVTYYINGIMRTTGSDIEGVDLQAYNATFSTSVEFLIPYVDSFYSADAEGESGEMEYEGSSIIESVVRDVITSALQLSAAEQYEDGNNVYYSGVQYSIAQAGTREVRAQVGDSISLNVYIDYFFIHAGVGSNGIILKINDERVFYSKIGITRTSTQEFNLASDTSDGSARVTTSDTILTIHFDMPTRLTAYDEAIAKYTLYGTMPDLSVSLTIPTLNGEKGVETATYTMQFADTGISGETNLCAATSATLVEKLPLVEVI